MGKQELWWWVVEEVNQVAKYIGVQSNEGYVLVPRFNHEGDFWITVSEENAKRITSIPAIEAQNAALKARVAELEEALEAIAQHDGLTMLHPDESALVDEQNAYSQGVSAGYEGLAAFARAALKQGENNG